MLEKIKLGDVNISEPDTKHITCKIYTRGSISWRVSVPTVNWEFSGLLDDPTFWMLLPLCERSGIDAAGLLSVEGDGDLKII